MQTALFKAKKAMVTCPETVTEKKEVNCVSLCFRKKSRISCTVPGSQTQRFLCGQSWAFWVGYMEPPEVAKSSFEGYGFVVVFPTQKWRHMVIRHSRSWPSSLLLGFAMEPFLSHFCIIHVPLQTVILVVLLMLVTSRGVYRATCLPCGNGQAEESIQLRLRQRRGRKCCVRRGRVLGFLEQHHSVEDGEAVDLQTCNYYGLRSFNAPAVVATPCWMASFPSSPIVSFFFQVGPIPAMIWFRNLSCCHDFCELSRTISYLFSRSELPSSSLSFTISYAMDWKSSNYQLSSRPRKSHPTDHLLLSLQLCSLFLSPSPCISSSYIHASPRNSNPFMPHRLGQNIWNFLEA